MPLRPEDSSAIKGVNRRVFWRSFFLETLWNYEKMQNVGFVFCLYPVLERLYGRPEDRREAATRHLEPVNTNPFLGPLLVGLTARLENDLDPTAVLVYRKRVMTTLAAQGDRIFWSHLRPLAAACGSLMCLWFFGSLVGGLAFLILYNVPHLLIRALGYRYGWKKGLAILSGFHSTRVESAFTAVRLALCLALGLFAGSLLIAAGRSADGLIVSLGQLKVALVLAIVALGGFLLLRRQAQLSKVVYAAALTTAALLIVLGNG
jgi:mannose/fructose/N-acetylgalactosamine-specific phosphotransferase system component IID